MSNTLSDMYTDHMATARMLRWGAAVVIPDEQQVILKIGYPQRLTIVNKLVS